MSIYRKIWEEFNNACIMPGMHIHHIDGNKYNNDPLNLMICTPKEHYEIHLSQNDYACAMLLWKNFLQNINTINISEIASCNMKKIHKTMKDVNPNKYSEWQRKRSLGKKRNTEQKERYKIGAEKRLSDPTFREKLSNSCKGTRKKKICPYCGKIGGGANMGRYHFNNCKEKIKEK